MNIDRNNYKEFFLLYADKELSAEEKNMVDIFLQQNNDLTEEFLVLQQAVLLPDKNIMLTDKSFLLKEDKKFISHKNYEEAFILYNDNELNEAGRKETENFLNENQSLQSEFALLQKVKLQTDNSIVFPGKKILYKKEDDGKEVFFKWWKIAAAAVLLGSGLWAVINYSQNNNTAVPVGINYKKTDQSGKKKFNPLISLSQQSHNVAIAEKNRLQNIRLPKLIDKNVSVNLPVKKSRSLIKYPVVKNNRQINKSPENKTIDKPYKPNDNDIAVKPERKNNVIKNKPTSAPEELLTGDLAYADKISPGAEPVNNYAQNASYLVDEKNENYIFYNVTTEKFNKSKLGSFLKKVKRVIQRKSPFNHRDSGDKGEVAVN